MKNNWSRQRCIGDLARAVNIFMDEVSIMNYNASATRDYFRVESHEHRINSRSNAIRGGSGGDSWFHCTYYVPMEEKKFEEKTYSRSAVYRDRRISNPPNRRAAVSWFNGRIYKLCSEDRI